MPPTKESELHEIAARLMSAHVAEPEFCLVYEDEELEYREDDWEKIYKIMCSAKISATFPGHDFKYKL